MSRASVYFTLGSIRGKHDVEELQQELDTLPGVRSVSVNERSGSVAVDFDTTGVQRDRIQRQIEKIGYEILDFKLEEHGV